MDQITTDDGVRLSVTETGSGTPIVFVHEFAGDQRSWELQLRAFGRRYRAVAYSARGYPPSDVPTDPAAYSQDRATDDIAAVLRGLGIDRAHIVGLSMGAFATLHFGMRHAAMAISLTAAGVGYGAHPNDRARFHAETDATMARIAAEGMRVVAADYGRGPSRLAFPAKDPRGFAEFVAMLAEHSSEGSRLTMAGVQRQRPSLFDLEGRLAAIATPTMIICGDEDGPTLEAGLFLKKTIPNAGLAVIPRTGHTMNLEEPEIFNRLVLDFITWVDAGRWPVRDPASLSASIIAKS